MYNEIIASRLSDLRYLGTLKNSNITIMGKKNEFSDIVKFYAQIEDNTIQKISFKATGCSTFLAMCSFFCELVEGKTVEQSLMISEKDLIKITQLDSSRVHVYSIILSTFSLLIKKYNKSLKKGDVKNKSNTIKQSRNLNNKKKIQNSHLQSLRKKIKIKEEHENNLKK